MPQPALNSLKAQPAPACPSLPQLALTNHSQSQPATLTLRPLPDPDPDLDPDPVMA
jgi:hypothetical protein